LSKNVGSKIMNFTIVHEQEDDGRWLAEVPELPGVLAYGANAQEAMSKAEALALRVIAERLEHGESRAIAYKYFHPCCCMSQGPSARAKRVLSALFRLGWEIKRQSGSHRTLSRPGFPDYVFAFHDGEEIGPRMLARIASQSIRGYLPATYSLSSVNLNNGTTEFMQPCMVSLN